MRKDGSSKKAEFAMEKTPGRAKEATGNSTDNFSLENEGRNEQSKRNMKQKTGQAQQNPADVNNNRR